MFCKLARAPVDCRRSPLNALVGASHGFGVEQPLRFDEMHRGVVLHFTEPVWTLGRTQVFGKVRGIEVGYVLECQNTVGVCVEPLVRPNATEEGEDDLHPVFEPWGKRNSSVRILLANVSITSKLKDQTRPGSATTGTSG